MKKDQRPTLQSMDAECPSAHFPPPTHLSLVSVNYAFQSTRLSSIPHPLSVDKGWGTSAWSWEGNSLTIPGVRSGYDDGEDRCL